MRTILSALVLCTACGNDEHVVPVDAMVDALEGDACATELLCPPPDAGTVTICGRLWDIEDDQPIDAVPTEPWLQCDPVNPATSGPCSLSVTFVDAADHSLVLVPPDGVYVDGCDLYRGRNIPAAPSGAVAVLVDDAVGLADRHRLTAVAIPNALANPAPWTRAYVTRISTDAAWSTPVFGTGATFADRGVVALVFRHQYVPRPNVQARRDGALIPDDDYYFTDQGIRRTTISTTTTSTGANGTALLVNSSTRIAHDGIGSEPNNCRWPSHIAAATPGVVFVQSVDAETATGLPCP